MKSLSHSLHLNNLISFIINEYCIQVLIRSSSLQRVTAFLLWKSHPLLQRIPKEGQNLSWTNHEARSTCQRRKYVVSYNSTFTKAGSCWVRFVSCIRVQLKLSLSHIPCIENCWWELWSSCRPCVKIKIKKSYHIQLLFVISYLFSCLVIVGK